MLLKFNYGLSTDLTLEKVPLAEGNVYICTDNGEIRIDVAGSRLNIRDVNTKAALEAYIASNDVAVANATQAAADVLAYAQQLAANLGAHATDNLTKFTQIEATLEDLGTQLETFKSENAANLGDFPLGDGEGNYETVKAYIDAKDLANTTAISAVKARVDTFLDGTGAAEDVIDTLQDLINFINTHDDVEIASILAAIQALETKVDTGDQTVTAYVTAAIEALKIGDYAKAADLTALAGRVADLEAKPFDTYATKSEVGAVDAKFADYTTSADLATQMATKADAASVVANDTFNQFKSDNTAAIGTAKDAAIAAAKAETEAQVGALEGTVANTYATKTELEGVKATAEAAATQTYVDAELAKKANVADVYAKTETFTKDEVAAAINSAIEAALTWETFGSSN